MLITQTSVKTVFLFSVLIIILIGCQVEDEKYEFEQGQQCNPYVDKYLSFHNQMTSINDIDKSSVLLSSTYVLPDIIANQEKLSLQTSAYIKREREILDISEYFVECDSNKDYAVIWFKIKDTDPRFKWLYIVIADGIMRINGARLD